MKWDNTSNLSPEVEKQINDHLQNWLDEKLNANGVEDSRDVQKLIIALYIIYKGSTSPLDKGRLQTEIIQKGTQWDTDDPAFAQIQKYINRVMKGQYNSASNYISEAHKHKDSLKTQGAKEQKHNQAKAGAQKRHEAQNKIKEKAIEFYNANKNTYASKKVAAYDLSKRFPELSEFTYKDIIKRL